MSHVSSIKLKIRSLESLKRAAQACGLEFREGQKQYRWFGYSVGDFPLPEGFTKEDLGKCDHALSIPNNPNAYEIGVVRNKDGDGYTLLWDFWQGGLGLMACVGQEGNLLKQAYAVDVASAQMAQEGFQLISSPLDASTGVRELVFQKF